MNTMQSDKETELASLKSQFIGELCRLERGMVRLQDVVVECFNHDVSPLDMVEWGVEAGYHPVWVRNVISQVLIARGQRRRKSGAGRKTPEEAIELANYAIERHKEAAAALLLAASRWARKHPAGTVKQHNRLNGLGAVRRQMAVAA